MHRSKQYLCAPLACSCLFLLCVSCGKDSAEVLAQAYVAPASVNVRSQLNQKNSTVAVVKHGDRVAVTDVRRRFIKIRTSKGAEGWIDSSDLLSQAEMDEIHRERQAAMALPPEGSATAYENLNIHLAPSRKSPAFARIAEGGSVTILARKVSPKLTAVGRGPSFTVEKPSAPQKKQRKERLAKSGFRLPSAPPPPKPPANWVAMSGGETAEIPAPLKTSSKDKTPPETPKPEEHEKPPVMESWTLVRTKAGEIGWALSRNLMMSIPDEVAQYAEGKHITSFFDLGSVNDEEKGQKHNWLWTTISGTEPYDFDSWRVFLWNRHRHRYETSYRQRDLEGYFPVLVDPPDASTFGRGFKLTTKDDDGRYRLRTYVFDGVRVHLTGTVETKPGEQSGAGRAGNLDLKALGAKTPQSGWLSRKWSALKQRLSGSR